MREVCWPDSINPCLFYMFGAVKFPPPFVFNFCFEQCFFQFWKIISNQWKFRQVHHTSFEISQSQRIVDRTVENFSKIADEDVVEKIVKPPPAKVFINNVDTYTGAAFATEFGVGIDNQVSEVVGTLAGGDGQVLGKIQNFSIFERMIRI